MTPLCALAVHQLRYYLAFGAGTRARLAHDGHSYLSNIEPFALLATAVAIGALIGALARHWRSPATARAALNTPLVRRRAVVRLWAVCAVTLLAIYCAQELFEGLFAPGHPAGLEGIFGHGGWIAVPAAIATGAALALTLRVAEAVIGLVARRVSRRRLPASGAGARADPGAGARLAPRAAVRRQRRPRPTAGLVAQLYLT